MDKQLVMEKILELEKSNETCNLSETSLEDNVLEFLYNRALETTDYDKYIYADLFKEYIQCMNNESDKQELIEEYICKMLSLTETLQVFIHLEDNVLKSIIKGNKVIECFGKNLMEYYKGKTSAFNAGFYVYEDCIEELCRYYKNFKQLFEFEEIFLDLLRYSISYSGNSGDIGYAYKGLEKVKNNIHVLGKKLIIKLLDCFEDYGQHNRMTDKQIFAIIQNSGLESKEERELKFFYIDRKYIEDLLIEKIRYDNLKLFEDYNRVGDEVTIVEDSSLTKVITNMIYKYNSKVNIKFIVECKKFSQIDFRIEFGNQVKFNIVSLRYNYQEDFFLLLDDEKEILNLRYDYSDYYQPIKYNSKEDKILDESIKDKFLEIKESIQKIIIGEKIENSEKEVDVNFKNQNLNYINIESFETNRKIEDIEKQIRSTKITKELLEDAKVLIEHRGARSAVDRIHTAFHDYLKSVCNDKGIPYKNDAGITSLFKLLKDHIIGLEINDKNREAVDKILKGLSTIVDSSNYLRNHASFAHSNDQLDEDEAVIVIDTILIILKYINSKLYQNKIL